MRKVLRIALICLVILVGLLIVGFVVISDTMLVQMLSSVSGNYSNKEKLERLINADTLRYCWYYMIFSWCLLLLILFRFTKVCEDLHQITNSFLHFISSVFRNDLKGRLSIILLIPMASALYFTFKMPVGYDEAWTWLNFTSRSVLVSATYYPAPNNHILHSILTNFFSYLPFSSVFNLRLPIILIQFLNLVLLYRLLKRFFSEELALVTVALFSTFFMTLYYSYMSRGYALQAFSFLLLSYSVLKIETQPKNKILWFWYVIAGITGFYSVPSFLYPWVLSNVILFWKLRKITREHLFYSLVTFIVVVYLYVPIAILNGYQTVLGVQDMMHLTRLQVITLMPGFIQNALYEFTGLHYVAGLILLLGGSTLLIIRYNNFASRYFVGMIAATPILLLLHGTLPFTRTIYFCSFTIAIAGAIIILELIKNIKQKPAFIIILMFLQMAMVFNYPPQVKIREAHSLAANRILLTIPEGRKFYVCSNLFDTYLIFNLRNKGVSSYSINYQNPRAIDVDTISNREQYDYIITDIKLDETRILKPISEDYLFHVYENN